MTRVLVTTMKEETTATWQVVMMGVPYQYTKSKTLMARLEYHLRGIINDHNQSSSD